MQWPFRRRFDVVNKRLGIEGFAGLEELVSARAAYSFIFFVTSRSVVKNNNNNKKLMYDDGKILNIINIVVSFFLGAASMLCQ